jgi:DUF1680 family protein
MQKGTGIGAVAQGNPAVKKGEKQVMKATRDEHNIPKVCFLFQLLANQEQYVIGECQLHDEAFGNSPIVPTEEPQNRTQKNGSESVQTHL